MPVVPGFQYDLFISYAHVNDIPLPGEDTGWVTAFVQALAGLLRQNSRDFTPWFDPRLRSGDDFNDAIAQGISGSAVFLSILSPAYDDSEYCKKEVGEFRRQRHPAFGMKVSTMSRMQGIVMDALADDKWPAEIRTTTPPRFFDERNIRIFPPSPPSAEHPYIKGLFQLRDSIWTLLDEMRKQKERGTVIERSYDVQASQSAGPPVVYLADVPDSILDMREELCTALSQLNAFQVDRLEGLSFRSGPGVLSVHLFDKIPGHPYPGSTLPLPRLQLEGALASNPVRRPLVWLARDLDPRNITNKSHADFLASLLSHNGIELVRTGFEDLKEEIQKRMLPPSSPVVKPARRGKREPIVHIWHEVENDPLNPLKQYLIDRNCAISVFVYAEIPREKLQSKLSICDGLIIPYTPDTRVWAEDVLTDAFRLGRRQELPIAFAPVELPPSSGVEFNFEHPRVVPVHAENGSFRGMDEFLQKLEDDGE